MNTLLLIFLAPFLTSTAVGQVESVQIQSSFFETTALKFYCRYGSVLNEDVSGCTPKTVVQEEPEQTVQEWLNNNKVTFRALNKPYFTKNAFK